MIKLSKSGKQVQVITDEGHVFATSKAYLISLLNQTLKMDWVLLKRLPFNVSPDRFKKSEIWIPEGQDRAYIEKQLGLANSTKEDSFSPEAKKKRVQKKAYTDIDI